MHDSVEEESFDTQLWNQQGYFPNISTYVLLIFHHPSPLLMVHPFLYRRSLVDIKPKYSTLLGLAFHIGRFAVV